MNEAEKAFRIVDFLSDGEMSYFFYPVKEYIRERFSNEGLKTAQHYCGNGYATYKTKDEADAERLKLYERLERECDK